MTTADLQARAQAQARAAVAQSSTSFAAGMRILPKARREAMHAIYAFCREIDDIADGDLSVEEKRSRLAAWRAEVNRLYAGAPGTPIGLALAGPIRAFDLPKEEFLLLIEGMEMDAQGPIVAPSMTELLAYTRRVAGAVGMLSMPVFGAPKGEPSAKFALALGDALQLTNILRDVAEDAAVGRLYLPREALSAAGVPPAPAAAAAAPGLAQAMRTVGAVARERFSSVRAALRDLDWRILRPALLMMGPYEAYLTRIEAGGWNTVAAPVRISRIEKAMIAARWYFAPKLKGEARAV